MKPLLTVDQAVEILRSTVPRLHELTDGATGEQLATVTGYGWSVSQQMAHLRSCHDILGGNMLRILREDHPSWKGRSPRSNQERYMELAFGENLEAFIAQRTELIETLGITPPGAWQRSATVTDMVGRVFEYDVLYYADWMSRHERSHLGHIRRVLEELRVEERKQPFTRRRAPSPPRR